MIAKTRAGIAGGRVKQKIGDQMRDPLYKNSFYIILTYLTSAAFGFFFWMIAGKLYSEEDVGVATAMISALTLLVFITRFGMDFSMIRFFPKGDRNRIFNTALVSMTGSSIVLGVLFVLGIEVFSPGLSILGTPGNAVLFIASLAAYSMVYVENYAFIALRNARFQFLQSLLTGSRVLLLPLMVLGGAIGIFTSVGIAYIFAAVILTAILAGKGIRIGSGIDLSFVRESLSYSAGNYVVNMLMSTPAYILPLLVLNTLGADANAYYYIAFMLATLIYMIPDAVSMSLLVEGSHGMALRTTVRKSIYISFTLISIAGLMLYVMGGTFMGFIGSAYQANSVEILRLLILASPFMAIDSIYFSIKRVQKDVRELIFVGGVICVTLVGGSCALMDPFGLAGVAYSWIISYAAGSLIVLYRIYRNRWFTVAKTP